MLFNSLVFGIFLPTVFIIYWLLNLRFRLKTQNLFVLVVSYIFYGWWDWRFLGLIFISSIVDYISALKIEESKSEGIRKFWMGLSLFTNLGTLGFFKYFNFFVDSFATLVSSMGFEPNIWTLQIILPVGISFYTFQTLSYTLDVYRRELKPTRDFVAFFAFVSFFPQLVAGPIERASALLPQFYVRRTFDLDKARDGLRQMLWGFAKKMIIADNLAPHVQAIYSDFDKLDSVSLFIGTFFFALQVYCDFSGYSDIAIGSARLFGFRLMRNFAFPLFSRDMGEFWRRWHISLSTWFRDYVYIPLGGSRISRGRQMLNILITFTISGLWHGANWNFVLWGTLNGVFLLPQYIRKSRVKQTDVVAQGHLFPTPHEALHVTITFLLFLAGLVMFRSASVGNALEYLARVLNPSLFSLSQLSTYAAPLLLSLVFLAIEWVQREKLHPLEIKHWPAPARWAIYEAVVLLILVHGNFGSTEFIYFQF